MAPNKSPRTTSSVKSKSHAKKGKTSSLLKSLPESVENIEIVQQVACVLEELQKRVLDVRAEASKELKKMMKRYENNYKGIEKKVHQVTTDAKKQAQTSMIQLLQKWHEHKERLPAPLTKEIEKIVEQIGMKVVAKHSASKKTPAKTHTTKTVKITTKTAPKKKPPEPKGKAKIGAREARARHIKATTKVMPMAPISDSATS